MKKIFIDAGHNPQGWNTGAEGNGMREQDIVYEVSKLLAGILKNDFIVKLSRPTEDTILGTNNNTAINTRWQMSNSWGADYFISVHTNAFKKDMATGAETFYFREDAFDFAKTIQDTYSKEMNLINRRTEYRGNLAVIRHTIHPSILLELGFIDHKDDAFMLKTKRLEMAKAIAKGIYKYFGLSRTENIIEVAEIKEEQDMRYNNINEVPDWGKSTIEKLIRLEMLNGNGEGLNLTEDMIRILVINDRAGLYVEYTAQDCVSTPVKYTTEEIYMLEKIVHAESRGEDEKGQILVANVILNRLESPYYPNTIKEIIYQPNQFLPIVNGTFESAAPQELAKQAVNKALNGEDYSQGALFFRSVIGLEGSWHQEKLTYLFMHGGHAFFK